MEILKQIYSVIMATVNSIIAPLFPAVDDKKVMAFLRLIRWAEGTDKRINPYAVVYAYEFTITDFSDHPFYSSHQWKGGKLSASMCINAGQKPGCVSTAAGAYQFIRTTWQNLKKRGNLPDFGNRSQDRAAIMLLKDCNSYNHILTGNIKQAILNAGNTWASLPGNTYGQNPKKIDTLIAKYKEFLTKI